MPTTKLTRWGNSQGIVIPKRLCETAGFRVGDALELTMNLRTGKVEITPSKPTLSRS